MTGVCATQFHQENNVNTAEFMLGAYKAPSVADAAASQVLVCIYSCMHACVDVGTEANHECILAQR
jgi:hypothetical protein